MSEPVNPSTNKVKQSLFPLSLQPSSPTSFPLAYGDNIWDVAEDGSSLAEQMGEEGQYDQHSINESLAEKANAAITTEEQSSLTNKQRNQALANVSNQTASNTFDGKMGYKVLKPYDSEDSTTEFAEQIKTQPNTIFEIRDVFDLGSTLEEPVSVTIPANCTLKFNGGRIVNGTIVGQNTLIDANAEEIFGLDVTLSGTFKNSEIYAEWFGAKADGVTDNIPYLQKAFDVAIAIDKPLQLLEGTYMIEVFDTESHRLNVVFTQDGQNLIVRGAGKFNTFIKCSDGWLDRQLAATNWVETKKEEDGQLVLKKLSKTIWNYSIYYYRDNNAHANSLEFTDLTFDKNATSNDVDEFVGTMEYEYDGVVGEYPYSIRTETTPFLTSAGATGYSGTTDHLKFKNIYLKELTAGGIGVGNITAKSILFNNISSDMYYIGGGATRREEIYPLANCDDVVINNCNIYYTQIEPVESQALGADSRVIKITNSNINNIEMNGGVWTEVNADGVGVRVITKTIDGVPVTKYYKVNYDKENIYIDNCVFGYFNFSGNTVRVTNSTINVDHKGTSVQDSDVAFENCIIDVTGLYGIQFYNRWKTNRVNDIQFNSCSILLGRTNGDSAYKIYGANADFIRSNVKFDSCYIESDNAYIDNYAKGLNLSFVGCAFRHNESCAVRCGGFGTYFGYTTFDSCKVLTKNLQLVDLMSNNQLYKLTLKGWNRYPIIVAATVKMPTDAVLEADCDVYATSTDIAAITVKNTIIPPNMRIHIDGYVYETPSIQKVAAVNLATYIKYFDENRRFHIDTSELSTDLSLDLTADYAKAGESLFAKITIDPNAESNLNDIKVEMDGSDITAIAHLEDSDFIYIPSVIGDIKISGGYIEPRYLAFKAVGGNGTITITIEGTTPSSGWSTPAFEYSTDGGDSWNSVTLGTAISVNENDKVYFKGENPVAKRLGGLSFYTHFAFSGNFEGSGDYTSIINGRGGWLSENDTYAYIAAKIFLGNSANEHNPLVKSPNFPLRYVLQGGFIQAFKWTDIGVAPTLYTESNIGSSGYNNTFYGCSNLNEIRTYMSRLGSNENGNDITQSWLSNTASFGNFYCLKSVENLRNIPNVENKGIPANWTRRNIDEDDKIWVGLSFAESTVNLIYTPEPFYKDIQEITITDNYTEAGGVLIDKATIEAAIEYQSTDENVAVIEDGKIVIMGNGTTTIFALYKGDDTLDYGSAVAEYTLVVSGVPEPQPEPDVEPVSE